MSDADAVYGPACLRGWSLDRAWWTVSTGGVASPRRTRRRCKELIRDFDVPRPFDLELFRQELERKRGRRIVFVPVETGARCPCGLWLATADTDYVFVERATSPLHMTHIALHEIGHILFGHQGISPYSAEFLAKALPTLDPSAVIRLLGRTAYSGRQEEEAETLATVVGERGRITDIAHRPILVGSDTARMLERLVAGLAEARDD
ncbi:hypothetical protein [Catellatospora sp. NPDC049133]|uniref:hypothetical protein n=1 Tax=Catellatospora sp. NPDC049133 TaxID=3155499 RepID=UPI0033F0A217